MPLWIAVVGVRKTGAFFESSVFHLAHFVGTQRKACRIAAQRADRIRRSFVILKRCCELHRLALHAPARTARPQLAAAQPHAVAAPRPQTREVTPKPLLRKAR